jgi:amino-acid N-acetyltransferase
MTLELQMERARAGRVQQRRGRPLVGSTGVTFRTAEPADAPALYALICSHLQEGRLLRRDLEDLRAHASRFVVATLGGHICGCAELAPLSKQVAEVRSLVVEGQVRGIGIGRQLVEELRRRAHANGFESLCAFTHDASYFVRLGFSSVEHEAVPEKIASDCRRCALFGQCGQHAVVLPLKATGPEPHTTSRASQVTQLAGTVST